MTVYRMISAEKVTGFPVSVACALLGVSRSAFYEWERGAPSDRELTDAWLLERITSCGSRTSPTCAPGRAGLLAAVQDGYSRRIVG